MAGAFAAYHDDANAFLWNPAALGSAREVELAATHFSSIVDTNFDQAALVLPFNTFGTSGGLGFSLQHSATNNLNQTDLAGNDLGTIENGDWVMGFSCGALMNPRLSLGFGIKGFNSRLAEFHSRGFALDFGAQSEVHRRVTLGAAFANLGQQDAYDQVADVLPSLLRMAVKAVVVDSKEVHITAALELDKSWTTSDPAVVNLGGEYWYQSLIAFRAGYRFGADTGNLSLGTGIKWKAMAFDYAYVSMGDLGLAQRFSMDIKLGSWSISDANKGQEYHGKL